jgi:hypothetical protein
VIAAWFGRIMGWGHTNGDSGGVGGAAPLTPAETAPDWLFSSDELAAELARTRRYGHDLSIVVLSVSPRLDDGVEEAAGGRAPNRLARLPHVVFLLTSGALRGMLRQSDIVYYQPDEEQYVIALAEASPEQARQAILRIGSLFRTRFSLRVAAGVAAFPHDGLTLPDLVATAVEQTHHAGLGEGGRKSPELVTTDSDAEPSRAG